MNKASWSNLKPKTERKVIRKSFEVAKKKKNRILQYKLKTLMVKILGKNIPKLSII